MSHVDPWTVDNVANGAVTDEQAVVIERTVIGAVMTDRAALNFITDEVIGADFADARLGRIFDGFYEMHGAKEPISPVTVAGHLGEWGIRGISLVDLNGWANDTLPHETGWFARKVHDLALRRELRAAATKMTQRSKGLEPAGELLADTIADLRQLQTRGMREEVHARSLSQILEQVDDAYEFVVEDLLERGDRLILTGGEGGGKTTLLRQIAIMAAAGLAPFSGFPTKPARVLYVDAENTEKQWVRESRRLAELATERGQGLEERFLLHTAKRMDLTKDRDLGVLHQLVDEHKPDILFIGPLYRLTPRAINSDDEATPLLTALDTIHDRGVTLAIEAHAGHGAIGAERDLRPRGSSALMGWPEFGLGIRPDKNAKSSNEYQLVRWRGHRDASRKWPNRLARGTSEWPWTPTITGMR